MLSAPAAGHIQEREATTLRNLLLCLVAAASRHLPEAQHLPEPQHLPQPGCCHLPQAQHLPQPLHRDAHLG